MSTTPTELLEAVPTEAGFDFDAVKAMLDNFDPAALLPDLSSIFGWIELVCRIAVLVGPIILAALGIAYLFFSPKEANYRFGYRCYFGMGSVEAWRFTQRLAGIVLGGLGLVLTVVMFFIISSFGGMDVMDMVWKSANCLIWEAVLALAANGAICLAAFFRFDRKGEYRKRKNK